MGFPSYGPTGILSVDPLAGRGDGWSRWAPVWLITLLVMAMQPAQVKAWPVGEYVHWASMRDSLVVDLAELAYSALMEF